MELKPPTVRHPLGMHYILVPTKLLNHHRITPIPNQPLHIRPRLPLRGLHQRRPQPRRVRAVIPRRTAPHRLGDLLPERERGFERSDGGAGARDGADGGDRPRPEGEVRDGERAGVGVARGEGGEGGARVAEGGAEGLVEEVEGEDCRGEGGGGGEEGAVELVEGGGA